MTVNKLMTELTSAEISEYMAFDQLKDDGYREKLKADLMTDEQRESKLMAILGYKK